MDIKIFKNKKKFVKRNLEKKLDFYWDVILYITSFLILTSFIFGLYFFLKINKESVVPVENINKQQIVEKERINAILKYFKEREKKSIEILSFPSPVVDPSL